MKFYKIEASRYDINLKAPFKNANTEYIDRTEYIIKLYIDDLCGCGEAAPLAFYSRESFNQIVWGFEELKNALCVNSNYTKDDLLDLFALYTNNFPSLNFALDISLYDILAQKNNKPISKYLNQKAINKVKFSNIYRGKINSSFKTIKVKFGIENLDNEINNFYKLSKRCSPSTWFRIDANKAYSVNDLLYLQDKLKQYNIEYIEEPLSILNIHNLKKIKCLSSIPIAIDESIFSSEYKKLIKSSLIDYVILKASLYGNIKNIFLLSEYLNKHKVKIILSSALQTRIGNLSNIHIAAALNLKGHHGLNNFSFFNYDSSRIPYSANDNSIILNNLRGLGVCWDD